MNIFTPTIDTCRSSCQTRPELSFWLTSLLACVLACLLATGISACGGGGSSSTTTSEGSPASLITAGAYAGTLMGKSDNLPKEWVTILLPTEPASGGMTKFFALHYDDINPDIYSGTGQITGKALADLESITYYPYLATSVRTGTGTLTSISSGEVRASLSFPAINSANALVIKNLDQKFASGYAYNSAASLESVQGNWQGNLSAGSGSNGAFTINISSTGTFSSSMSFLGDCQFSQGQLKPSNGANLYTLTVSIPSATACTQSNLGGKALTGAVFTTKNATTGKAQLYLVGITSDGRGISFKAER